MVGQDGVLILQILSLAAGLLFVGASAAYLPPGWRGTVSALSIALLTPLAAWSGDAMETVAHGLLLAGGWSLLLTQARWRDLGLGLLVLSAISRPEAHVHVAASVLLMAGWSPVRETWRRIIGVAAVLGAFHALRFWWFGSLVPNPLLAKGSMGPTFEGASQVALDLLLVAPPVVFLAALFRLERWRLALMPLALQAFVVGLGPLDWMGAGRLVLPGAMATIAVLVAFVRVAPARRGVWPVLLLPMASVGLLLESGVVPGQDRASLSLRPVPRPGSIGVPGAGIETPFIRDVAFLAGEIPSGGHIYTGDVGIVGHLPELQVWDTAGLIDRAVAEHRASGVAVSAELEARVDGTADSAVCYKQRALETPAAIREDLPGYRIRMAFMKGAVATAWLCRDTDLSESDRLVIRGRRLRAMADLFPAHAELHYELARAVASTGDLVAARQTLDRGANHLPSSTVWRRGETGLLFSRHDRPGTWAEDGSLVLRFNGMLLTRPLDATDLDGLALSLRARSGKGAAAVVRLEAESCRSDTFTVTDTLVLPLSEVSCARAGERLQLAFVNDGLVGEDDVDLVVGVTRTLPARP